MAVSISGMGLRSDIEEAACSGKRHCRKNCLAAAKPPAGTFVGDEAMRLCAIPATGRLQSDLSANVAGANRPA